MEIQFENKRGVIRFFGGGSAGDWHILDVEGLGLVPLNVQSVTYYGENGQETVNKSLPGRPITLTAEVKGRSRNERALIVSKALRVLAHDGVLRVRTFRERVADCYLKSCTEGARDGNFRTYVFQFVCDSPYFRDMEETIFYLSRRTDLLTDGFVIGDGVVLTERISGGVINNSSDVEVRGRIVFSSDTKESVVIENKTTGALLKFSAEVGKTYTVDLDKRLITDEEGNNCMGILDDEYYLSDFYLEEGLNEIVVSTDGGDNWKGTLRYLFYKNYVEATD